jgi:two-component system, NtrC family, sensor kinase
MRRGTKPTKPKAESKRPVAPKSRKTDAPGVRDREEQLAEAREQQAATAEILRVISQSPTDFQPVFDTIVRNAAALCNAFDAVLVLADGDDFVQRAHCGPIETALGLRFPLRGTVNGRAILEGRVIQVENPAEVADEYPVASELARRIGYGTTLSVPLLRDRVAIGAIGIRRTEVLPFRESLNKAPAFARVVL